MSLATAGISRLDTEIGDRLEFRDLPDADDTSWLKARPYRSDFERLSKLGWKVRSPEGEEWHHVVLGRKSGGFIGACDCKGFEYNPGPCVHLCALRKSAWGNRNLCRTETDINDRPVRLCDLDEADAAEQRYWYLTDLQREAFLNCDLGDMGVREYQREKGYSSPGTVSNRLKAAREKVRKHDDDLIADGGTAARRDPVTDDRRLLGEGVDR
ncbi:SWIM zinc finger family protein [Halorubrum sp. SS5]|nr:SWIM zinc finger family protein [Halorubrum sp. SS5]